MAILCQTLKNSITLTENSGETVLAIVQCKQASKWNLNFIISASWQIAPWFYKMNVYQKNRFTLKKHKVKVNQK